MADTPMFGRRGAAPPTSRPPIREAGESDPAPRVRRSPALLPRVLFYLALAVLDVLGMQRDIFSLALWLIAPGLILVAVHWAALYLPLVDWPLTAWRRTRSPVATILWLVLALAPSVGLPLLYNQHQTRLEARDRAADLAPATRLPAPRTLLISAGDCEAWCQSLFAQGLVDHVLLASVASVSPGSPAELRKDGARELAPDKAALIRVTRGACPAWERVPGHEGWCLTRTDIANPRYDAIVRFDPGEAVTQRDPPAQIAVWSCPGTCTRVAQRTGLARDRLAAPLTVTYVSGSVTVDPRFARRPVAGPDLDPARTLAAVFALTPTGGPRQGPLPAALDQGMPAYEAIARQAEADVKARNAEDRRRRAADEAERLRMEAVWKMVEARREARSQCYIAANRSETDDLLVSACKAMP